MMTEDDVCLELGIHIELGMCLQLDAFWKYLNSETSGGFKEFSESYYCPDFCEI